MNEKKKTSSSKKEINNNKAAGAKKTGNTKTVAKKPGNTKTVAKKPGNTKTATSNHKNQNKKPMVKSNKKELPVVASETKKKDKVKTLNKQPIKNKPMEHSESAKVEKQLKARFRGNDEMSKLVRIVLIVTGIMVVFYGVTLFVTKKSDEVKTSETNKKEQAEKVVIQYENIMIGTMLNRGGMYYTLIEEENDNRNAEYDSLIKTIKSSEDAPTIYKANLTDAFNRGYLGKEENYYAENIAEFKVTGTTLLKITDGKVAETFDNYDSIKNKLAELA